MGGKITIIELNVKLNQKIDSCQEIVTKFEDERTKDWVIRTQERKKELEISRKMTQRKLIDKEKNKKNERERKHEEESKNWWWENYIFSRKCSGKFLQGGYQIGSDTMLWNMTSMEEMREK